jgi:hypothetical protein
MSKGLGQIMLTFLSIVFMRFIIKIAFSTKTGISLIDNTTEKLLKFGEERLKDIPIVPVAGGLSVNDIYDKKNGKGILNQTDRFINDKFREISQGNQDKVEEAVNNML